MAELISLKQTVLTNYNTVVIHETPTSTPNDSTNKTKQTRACDCIRKSIFSRWLLFSYLTIVWLVLRLTVGMIGDLFATLSAFVLAIYAATHFRAVLGLKTHCDKMKMANEEFQYTNDVLQSKIVKLNRAISELSSLHDRLQNTTREYKINVEKFKMIDEKLRELAKHNISDMKNLQEVSKRIQDTMRQELLTHEFSILVTVKEIMEFDEDKQGVNESEFHEFVSKLPKYFQDEVYNSEQKFPDLASEDGIIYMDEFSTLMDNFAVHLATKVIYRH
eukprot:52213_1